MSISDPAHSNPIRLYHSGWHDCGYFQERLSRTLFIDPQLSKNSLLYGLLQQSGFRRSGDDIYRPDCDSCQDCISTRLPVNLFKPRRRHRRLLKKNDPIFTLSWAKARLTDENLSLYQRYIASRHGDGEMANPNGDDFQRFLLCSWGETRFLQVHHEDKLIAIAVTDITTEALSAVYTFFDPDYIKSGLGVYCVLKQISEAQKMGLRWLYLGFWVPNCRKMAYKIEYRPSQLLINGIWQNYAVNDTAPTSGSQSLSPG